MAKAALEAASRTNLFGSFGTHTSQLHVDPDAHNRNRMTLNSLLPRQSAYKNSDPNLVLMVGFPFFAVEDRSLVKATIDLAIKTEEFRYNLEYHAALDITGYLRRCTVYPKGTFSESNFTKTSFVADALSIISFIVTNDLVTKVELDPCKRYIGKLERNVPVPLRYNFREITVNVVLIAESNRGISWLKSNGILAQTREQVYPVEIWSPEKLLNAFSCIGKNSALGLHTGRPLRPLGSLGTSQLYRLIDDHHSKLILPYSLAFDIHEFYMANDLFIVIDRIWSTMQFLQKYWCQQISPVFVVLVRDDIIFDKSMIEKQIDQEIKSWLSMLSQIKSGNFYGVPTKITSVSEVVNQAEQPICIDITIKNDFIDGTVEQDTPPFLSKTEKLNPH